MPELSLKERLQPSLLDRLTDDHPEDGNESRDSRVLSVRQLRACVLRDLSWLLNCESLGSSVDLLEFPEVEKSVLNYGIPSLSGAVLSRISSSDLEHEILRSVLMFEPRILPQTLKIRIAATSSDSGGENSLSIQIEGQLWAQPLPQRLFLRTELDLDTGHVAVIEDSD